MKLTKGKLTGASACGESTILSILAPGQVKLTPGEEVAAIGINNLNAGMLTELHDYLIDRPALMDDAVVKKGVYSLRALLNIPTPLSEL